MTPDQLAEIKERFYPLRTDVHALIAEVEKLQAEKLARARQAFQAEARLVEMTTLVAKQGELVFDWIKRWELQQQQVVKWMHAALTRPGQP